MNRETVIQWVGCLRALHREYQVPTELRVLKKNPDPNSKKPYLGFTRHFDAAQAAADYIENFDEDDSTNYYALLNPVTPGKASNDVDVLDYLWLPIDLDPIRHSVDEFGEFQALLDKKVPSTDEELELARRAANFIKGAFKSVFPDLTPCVEGESGNGIHLLYRIQGNPENIKETASLVHGILEKLHDVFRRGEKTKDLWVDVDRSVSNPARIWKVYGTTAKKGTNTPERPWREAKITKLGDPLTHTSLSFDDLVKFDAELQTYINDKLPKKEIPATSTGTLEERISSDIKKDQPWLEEFRGIDLTTTDIIAASREAGVLLSEDVRVVERANRTSSRLVPVRCPNHESHSMDGGLWESAIMLPTPGEQFANFHCQHDNCAHLTGSETAYRMIGREIVAKHSECFEVGEEIHLDPTSTFEPTRDRKSTTEPGKDDPNVESGPVLEPWIDEKWLRPLTSIMVEPDPKDSREQLVEGLIKRGEVTTVQAPTKVGKTFSLMHMSLAWGHESGWMGFKATRPLRVLFVDPELLHDEGEKRFRWVAFNVLENERATDNVTYINLRGKPIMCSDNPWDSLMIGLKDILSKHQFDLVIIDSIYQFQGERDPNASAEVVRMMNKLRAVTENYGQPGVLYVHHFAKGNPTAKTSLDRAAGSYAFNAAADNVIVVSPHEKPNHYILEFHLRHQASPPTTVGKLRDDIRLLDPAPDEDPNKVNTAWGADVTLGEQMLRILLTLEEESEGDEPIKNAHLKVAVKKRLGVSDTRVSACMSVMEEEENVTRHGRAAGLGWKLTCQGRQIARGTKVTAEAHVPVSDLKEDSPMRE